jgi:hypothetical protein
VFVPVLGAALAHAPILVFDLFPTLAHPIDAGVTIRGSAFSATTRRGAASSRWGPASLCLPCSCRTGRHGGRASPRRFNPKTSIHGKVAAKTFVGSGGYPGENELRTVGFHTTRGPQQRFLGSKRRPARVRHPRRSRNKEKGTGYFFMRPCSRLAYRALPMPRVPLSTRTTRGVHKHDPGYRRKGAFRGRSGGSPRV